MPSGPLVPSALDPDTRALADAADGWLARRSPPSVVREALEAPPGPVGLPGFWDELVSLGWIGLAVGEAHGGQGAGLAGLAAVLEAWGRAVAPGPFPGTALAATVVGACAPQLVEPLLGGEPAAVVWRGDPARAAVVADGGADAEWFLVPVGHPGYGADDGGRSGAGATQRWALAPMGAVEVTPVAGVDPTRRPATVSVPGPLEDRWTFDAPAGLVELVATVVSAAESVGVAAWCVHTAAEWARTREQFDRPIGQFQAVKHRCADALCRLELARAATWDASGLDPHHDEFAVAVAAAGALAPTAAFECAKDTIQVLGGIGYTWEHDAHLYLRRATSLHHLSEASSVWRARTVAHAAAGGHRTMRVELPPAAEGSRSRVREELATLTARPKEDWNDALADDGWLCPHWPEPWGRGAGPIEQLVIDEELAAAGVRRRHLQVAGWVLPTLIAHGTAEQQQRWIPASLRGEVAWCQLFSEPGAGSDLASLTTRAERTDGGWLLTGQKVWTTMAREADLGLCLARTSPDATKHDGITCFVVDMSAEGIDVRPLRELTGMALFNEVFLDDVFVPDDAVVGAVDDGWRCARTTLENERVSMASGSSFGPGVLAVVEAARTAGRLEDPLVCDELGSLLVTSQALAVLGRRTTLRALGGSGSAGSAGSASSAGSSGSASSAAEPGPEASIRKLVAVEHEQAVQEAGMALLGPDAVVDDAEGARWFAGFLGNRALSIAGGTSEIQRNVVAERLLGLPRDP